MKRRGAATLIEVLDRPETAPGLAPADWVPLLASARHSRLLSRLAIEIDAAGLLARVPAGVARQLEAARPVAAQHERMVRWEVRRIAEALRGVDTTLVLLKGAAFVMAGLPAARGRLVTDIDVMVPARDLRTVEQALGRAGWRAVKLDPYDQRFYRQWSHELPPLEHARRLTVVDVHHNILPPTGRLRPDAAKLLTRAEPLPRPWPGMDRDLFVLCPEDLVLHCAVHLFQDGDVAGSLRDLVDARALLQDFGARVPGFWDRLVPRAAELGLGRPLFYTLRYSTRLLGLDVPPAVLAEAEKAAPPWPILKLMDALVARAILPLVRDRGSAPEEVSRLLLYVRSHWLRMPPGRLAAHLLRKATRRFGSGDDGTMGNQHG